VTGFSIGVSSRRCSRCSTPLFRRRRPTKLRKFLAEVGDSDEEVNEIFAELNKSKSGLLSLDEWKACEFFEGDD
jgi:hypothetical protein